MQITPNQLDLACDLLWSREQLGGETYDEHDIERVAAAIAQRVWLERQMPEVFGFQAQYIYDPKYYLSPQSKRRRR